VAQFEGQHVFISYRQIPSDKRFARRLAEDLRLAGHTVWIDVEGIGLGDTWNVEIQHALDACYAYIVVVSPEAMESRWVRNELLYTLNHKAAQVFPVLLRTANLPPELIGVQYVDFRVDYDAALAQLLAALPDPLGTAVMKPLRKEKKPLNWIVGGLIGLLAVSIAVIFGLRALMPKPTPTPEAIAPPATESPTDEPGATPGETPDTEVPTEEPGPPSGATPAENPLSELEGRIVYACFINGYDQICMMNPDGSNQQQLTDMAATSWYPSLSPDGETIVFSSNRTGVFDIWSMNTSGTNLRRLTENLGTNYSPSISPDGTRIVFTSTGPEDAHQNVWMMDVDGRNKEQIIFCEDCDSLDPEWSPDGSMISFSSSMGGSFQLYVANADGSDAKRLTAINAMGGRNDWSPDGTQITFYAGAQGSRQIYVINVDGTDLRQLTTKWDNKAASFSLDGEWLVYASRPDIGEDNALWMMHPDGTGQQQVTFNDHPDWQPRWGP
jgi:TolB protein